MRSQAHRGSLLSSVRLISSPSRPVLQESSLLFLARDRLYCITIGSTLPFPRRPPKCRPPTLSNTSFLQAQTASLPLTLSPTPQAPFNSHPRCQTIPSKS